MSEETDGNSGKPRKSERKPRKNKDIEPLDDLGDIKGYNADELEKELASNGYLEGEEEKTPDDVLMEIRVERERLKEEREEFLKEIKEKKEEAIEAPEDVRDDEIIEVPAEPVISFAQERRKRKELERIKTYLFGGEYVLVTIIVFALIYAEGIIWDPENKNYEIPLENAIYLIAVFFLIIKVERFYFRFLNMKYSGTLQRKMIGVEHFTGLEWFPIFLGLCVGAAFVIPFTGAIIDLIVQMIVRDVIPLSEAFVLNLGLLILGTAILSVAWILFLRSYKSNVLEPEMRKIAEPFTVEDAFLITNSGLLLRHLTRELKPGVDDDILTGMLTAVKDFVKDSFRANEEGELDELQYGRLRILIEYGRDVYMALVIRGQESIHLRPEMKRSIRQIQRKYGRIFEGWDGNLSRVKGIENLIQPLVALEQ
jgi:hypothetical protein